MGRRRRDERAVSTLEMAFIAPVFLLLIFGMVEFGLWMYTRNVVTLAAREGASYLRVSGAVDDPAGWESAAEQTAIAYAKQVGLITSVTAEAWTDPSTGRATVRVCADYVRPANVLPGGTECQTVEVEIEQWEPDTGVPNV